MKQLNDEITLFFQAQGCVILSSIDINGFPHSSCKDIVKITKEGRLYLLDAYQGVSFKNLKQNPAASVTAFDEHKFVGYCLKGNAEVLSSADLTKEVKESWEARITSRVTQRLLKNIKSEKPQSRHHEVYLPEPKNVIMLEVEEIIDLKPRNLN